MFREKWRIALDRLNEIKPQLPTYQTLVFDAGYGVILPLLAELERRGEPYIAQVPGNIAAWPMEAVATVAQAKLWRPANHAKMQDPDVQPPTMTAWRDRLLQKPSRWKEMRPPRADGASVRAVALRVQASQRQGRWRQPGAARWLLIEQLGDGTFKYHLSNLSAETALEELVRLAHQHWAIEQQLKEELGLDHFEGRPWRGLHRQVSSASSPDGARQKKLCSLPEVRRWLIEALSLCLSPPLRNAFFIVRYHHRLV